MEFVIKKSSTSRRPTLKGKGGSNARTTLAKAKEALGELVKKGKAKEGDKFRCAVMKDDQKRDEWTISARAKNAAVKKAAKKSTTKKAS